MSVWYLIVILVSAFIRFVTPWCVVSACVRGKMAASTSPQTQTIAEKLSDCRCCNKSDALQPLKGECMHFCAVHGDA